MPNRRKRVLMIDIGGSNIKLMVDGSDEMRKAPSSREMTALQMCDRVKELAESWEYDAITIGYPGLVRDGKLVREPLNLGGEWVAFDFETALERPVRIINDAALQALASYEAGRMLFLGFGTSIGAALVADGVVTSVELGLMPHPSGGIFMERLTKEARKQNGHRKWEKAVNEAVPLLRDIFWPDDTVVGGGNAKHIEPLPEGCRRRGNRDAIVGARRLWEGADLFAAPVGTTWRISGAGANGKRDVMGPGPRAERALAANQ